LVVHREGVILLTAENNKRIPTKEIAMNEQKKKALILGCGIAGPAVALFLKRAGFEAEIFEARKTPEGFALSLSSNGVEVLKMLGLDGPVMAEGSPVTRGMMWNGKGKRLGEVTLAGEGRKSVFIKRVPLGMILAEEAERQGINIERGKKLESIEVTSTGGVVATFQDGTTARGDLLLGCDGVHSRTRQLIDPAFSGPVYTGLMNTGGYTSGVQVSSPPETTHFIFGKRAFFGYHVSPSGYIYWFANYVQAQEPVREASERSTHEERKQRLLELFRDDEPFIREIIGAAEEIFPDFPSYALPTQPASWHKGRVVLLGDAAHAISPSSGQGASMALEDAVVLAKCLRDIPNSEQAFATYEHLRRERTAKMFELGQRGDSGKFVTRPLQQWFRDLTTPIFLKLFANPKASDWIYSYRVDWDAPVTTATADSIEGREMVSHAAK
jgi:2-polyprenyl-6-methoxyphenol hydroxylase-like FAD-dependent oxidoreductase